MRTRPVHDPARLLPLDVLKPVVRDLALLVTTDTGPRHYAVAFDVPVVVISEKQPIYLSDEVTYVKCDGYIDAMRKATEVADEILWMNDDIHLLAPTTWDELRVWYAGDKQFTLSEARELQNAGNKWNARKGEVFEKLLTGGFSTFNFSVHAPIRHKMSWFHWVRFAG